LHVGSTRDVILGIGLVGQRGYPAVCSCAFLGLAGVPNPIF
jgi:hypothetical protein